MTIPLGPGAHDAAVAAEALLTESGNGGQPMALHAEGVALLLIGDDQRALRRLRDAASRESHATWWNDVAATELRLGDTTGEAEPYVAALEAAGRALALDPRLAVAHFNRAIATERLGFERAATADWQSFLRLEAASPWSDLVRRHVLAIRRRPTARERWTAARARLPSIPAAELERLIVDCPQEARLWGETMLLTDWAASVKTNPATATLSLERTRLIADRIASRSGEYFLREAVDAIDRAGASAEELSLNRLAAAYTIYMEGRVAFRRNASVDAAQRFERARVMFDDVSSPMASVAELYRIKTEVQRNRSAEVRGAT